MSNTYSLGNQIYALGSIINPAYGLEFTSFDDLQAYVTQAVTTTLAVDQGPANSTNTNNYLGSINGGTDWQLVWGPVVFTADDTATCIVSDNVMALFYNDSENIFVVSIAGTNTISTYDWFSENFDVSTTVPWVNISDNGAPGDAVISQGAATGFNILLNMADENDNLMIDALQSFIFQLGANQSSLSVAVVGHSLGAALTALMALYMFENVANWNPAGEVADIAAYPTASPTPGDSNFAAYYESLLTVNSGNSTPCSFTYTHFYNSIDVIPQGWELDMMINMPFLYDNQPGFTSLGTPPDAMIAALVSGGIASSFNASTLSNNNYTQITSPTSGTFLGVYQVGEAVAGNNHDLQDVWKGLNIGIDLVFLSDPVLANSAIAGNNPSGTNYINYLIDFGNFMLQMMYQHAFPYYDNNFINIADFITEYQGIIVSLSPTLCGSSTLTTGMGRAAEKLLQKHLHIRNISRFAGLAKAAKAKKQ